MCVQIALLYWELRETPGGKVTPRPRSAPPSSCSWPRLFGRWWTKVTKIVLNLVTALWCSELCSCHHFLTDHFRPRRSLVFASWSAGEYGNIGATEWLEASAEQLSVHSQRNCWLKKKKFSSCACFQSYMSSVDRSVFTYISLDGVVMGEWLHWCLQLPGGRFLLIGVYSSKGSAPLWLRQVRCFTASWREPWKRWRRHI